MIRNLVARFTLVTLVAAACSGGGETAPNASKAISEAQARAEDLANSNQSYQPVRFVSEIEQVRQPRPVTRRVVADVVEKGTDLIAVETVVEPTPVTTLAEPEVAADSTVDISVSRVPSIMPRSAPQPEVVGGGGSGAGEWRGRDPGPDMGTVIGVVLRGGRVDPGHCPRHPHPSQIPSQIPNRIPR